jgi:hypothetical protein
MTNNSKKIILILIITLSSGCVCIDHSATGLDTLEALPFAVSSIRERLDAAHISTSRCSLLIFRTKPDDAGETHTGTSRGVSVCIDKEEKCIEIHIDLETSKGVFTPIDSSSLQIPADCKERGLAGYTTILSLPLSRREDASRIIMSVFRRFYRVSDNTKLESLVAVTR